METEYKINDRTRTEEFLLLNSKERTIYLIKYQRGLLTKELKASELVLSENLERQKLIPKIEERIRQIKLDIQQIDNDLKIFEKVVL